MDDSSQDGYPSNTGKLFGFTGLFTLFFDPKITYFGGLRGKTTSKMQEIGDLRTSKQLCRIKTIINPWNSRAQFTLCCRGPCFEFNWKTGIWFWRTFPEK